MKKTAFAQNKIDYIVYSNPKKVARMIYNEGYTPPKNVHALVKTTKALIRQEGKNAIKQLITLHPDREVILSNQPVKNKEDHYCGACNSYAYDPEDSFCGKCGHSSYDPEDKGTFITQLQEMNLKELENYYKTQLDKSNKHPEDLRLGEEVRMIWNELRIRREKTEKKGENEDKEEKFGPGLLDYALIGSCIFFLGFLAGMSTCTKP